MVDGFRGVSVAEDVRFKDKEDSLLKSTKFPASFDERVDTSKVSLQVMRPWISERIERLLGFEDDVLVELVNDHLETEQFPDPRKLQISLTGFLEKKARPFMAELWSLLLSAQESVGGIPRAFVEQKKLEMQQKRTETDHVMGEVRRRGMMSAPPPHDAPGTTARWDRGRPPLECRDDGRRRAPDAFVDKRGNVTRRERDSGWVGNFLIQGPRAGKYSGQRERACDDFGDLGEERSRNRLHDQSCGEDRYVHERYGRSYRRSESPH